MAELRGQIYDKKSHSGGTTSFKADTYSTLTDKLLEIDYRGKGIDITITLHVDELLEFLKEGADNYTEG